MNNLTQNEYDIAQRIRYLTRDTWQEKMIAPLARRFVSGHDRHSYGMILASPEQIDEYGFMDFEQFYGQNIAGDNGISFVDPNIRDYLRQIRWKEGTTLIEVDEGYAHIVRNGIILPKPTIAELEEQFGVSDISAVIDQLGIDEEVGGKTLALLAMSMKYPDVPVARFDGRNFVLKGGQMYDLDNRDEGYYSPVQLSRPEAA